jgi:hypothetical protein
MKRAFAAVFATGALALTGVGCASSTSTEPNKSRTTTAAAPAPTTTEAAPEPITDDEESWLAAVHRYEKRLSRDIQRSGSVTHLSMSRSAKLYRKCASTVEAAGDPGRFAPASVLVEKACHRLDKAARNLDVAISVSDEGGAVIAGTTDAERFDHAFSAAFEAAGNAQYDLTRAFERADAIRKGIESA